MVQKNNREQLRKIADWLIPPAIVHLLRNYSPRALHFYLTHLPVFRQNRKLRNRHLGERCFILCNGPSVKEQDIKLLRGETVLSVSNGYRHPDYLDISPKYHFVPQITYAMLPPERTVDWFKEMHQSIGYAELFLSWQEWSLVNENKLFAGRVVNYLCMGKRYFSGNDKLPDLEGIIPTCGSVPIMALMTALYMGFSQIYLIGVEHDFFVKKEYKYFYEGGREVDYSKLGTKEAPWDALWNTLPIMHKLWRQYREIKRIARANQVTIYNATFGGMLDEFERVSLEDVAK